VVDQLVDLFRTTHKVKTQQQMVQNRGDHCWDIEITGYLVNTVVPLSLVLDLRITHDRFGSNCDPNLNGHLHFPNDIDRSLNEVVSDKIRKYRSDYNNLYHDNPPKLLFLQVHRETDLFFHLQEFSLCNLPVESSTSTVPCSPHSLKQKSVTPSSRL
jgi:hypothetical protein